MDGSFMKVTYLKFLSEQDRVRAFETLSSFSEVIGLEDDVYCISLRGLRLLDEHDVCYMVASEDEVRSTCGRGWRFDWRRPQVAAV